MKKLDENVPHFHQINNGWAVHIYDKNRRLLCTLDPSHCWSMLAGLILGIILTASWASLVRSNHHQAKLTPEPMQAPLAVD